MNKRMLTYLYLVVGFVLMLANPTLDDLVLAKSGVDKGTWPMLQATTKLP